ncbi:MAG: coenzyme F420-0:L-glutamate ligase [Candidatus Nomurabacteria bacterium]|nr:coenzyme F420-0:L-glutamate ligase [Candidatus Nomurabacteria bacterium]
MKKNSQHKEKKLIMELGGQKYARIPVQTHVINFGEDLISIIKKYVTPEFKNDDCIAISEKVISVCQKNVRHISTVKVGWLARFIVKGVKKYPNDVGFSRAEKMQVAVDISGKTRMIFAIILGAVGKIFGIRGIFWIVAGKRVSEIDGFNPDAMDMYKEHAVLPPANPVKICQEIEDKLHFPSVIIDGNNINVKILGKSNKVLLNKKELRLILLDNPMGQNDELTPFVIIRKSDKIEL